MQQHRTDSSVGLASWLSTQLAGVYPRLTAAPVWGAEPSSDGVLASETFGFAGQVLGVTYELVTLNNQRLETAELLSRTRTTTFSVPPDPAYAQGSLTDGSLPSNTRDPGAGWLGWNTLPGMTWTIDVPLGSLRYVSELSVYAFSEASPGIRVPLVDASLSSDGLNFTPAGRLSLPVQGERDGVGQSLSLKLAVPIRASAARLTFTSVARWTLLGEVAVNAADHFTTTRNLRVSTQLAQGSSGGKLTGAGRTVSVTGLLRDAPHNLTCSASGFALSLGGTGVLVAEQHAAGTVVITDSAAPRAYVRAANGTEGPLHEYAYLRPGQSLSLRHADDGAPVSAGPFVEHAGLLPPTTTALLAGAADAGSGEVPVIQGGVATPYTYAGPSVCEPRLAWLMR